MILQSSGGDIWGDDLAIPIHRTGSHGVYSTSHRPIQYKVSQKTHRHSRHSRPNRARDVYTVYIYILCIRCPPTQRLSYSNQRGIKKKITRPVWSSRPVGHAKYNGRQQKHKGLAGEGCQLLPGKTHDNSLSTMGGQSCKAASQMRALGPSRVPLSQRSRNIFPP